MPSIWQNTCINWNLRQTGAVYPTPSTLSAMMYYTGIDRVPGKKCISLQTRTESITQNAFTMPNPQKL